MTPEQIELHRKRFEELMSEHPSNCKKDKNGRYLKPRIEYLFKGYLMAIESIEIDRQHIPMSCCMNFSYKKGFDDCNDRFIESIQSLGLKVKER